MNTIQKVNQIVGDAELALRKLITEALDAQEYSAVKKLADFADNLVQLASASFDDGAPPDGLSNKQGGQKQAEAGLPLASNKMSKSSLGSSKNSLSSKKTRAKSASKAYPLFVRDGNRLVKIGWSKKNRREYEHRVPDLAVHVFLNYLAHSIKESEVFDIDSLFPVVDETGNEVPGYQVYVIIAWLRDIGIIEKIGRDGYVVRDKSKISGEVDNLWNSLQSKDI